jgi:8-oxo-dGTP pyrophosphatase MutT (NUDIX family)
MPELPPPIPAATLVLMREREQGPPELLMMERSAHMAFAAGALVFPGGRIEPQDAQAAAALAGGSEEEAAKIGAIRETLEETGIATGLLPPPGRQEAEDLRGRLLAGEPFEQLLRGASFRLDLESLVPFARWCPNFRETRRFDAIFFIAQAGADVTEATAQAGEATRVLWASAADILAELDAGRAHAIFPTRRNLERLARFNSFAEACADAQRHPVRTITPWVERRGGGDFVCIPEDAGYPVTSEPIETARRR